jgi:Putative DNA-binding domain
MDGVSRSHGRCHSLIILVPLLPFIVRIAITIPNTPKGIFEWTVKRGKMGNPEMLNYRYSPFTRPLQELTGDDLAVLRDVSEGWFVDYKSQALSSRDFAKHISAFGNQFGGWLFVGVGEGPNKSTKAETFPGIPTPDVGKVLGQIREAISAHISPPIYFEQKVIDGPAPALGLAAERSIIVVGIPEGPNPPYVHSSGRIYRRIADSSDPKPESDRAVLDSMWRKSEEGRRALEDFILKPTTRGSEVRSSICYVYLFADLTFSGADYALTYSEFREAMLTEKPESGPSLPLDSIYPTPDGFIARQVGTNNPLADLVALRWWRNGNVRLAIPLNRLQPSFIEPEDDERLGELIKAMGKARKLYPWILDLDQWLLLVTTLTSRFIYLREKLQMTGAIFGKMLFTSMGGSTPFVGMPSYLETVSAFGIPVVQDSIILCPTGTTPNSFQVLVDSKNATPIIRAMALIMPLTVAALRAMGVPIDTAASSLNRTISEVGGALDRAVVKSQRVKANLLTGGD